MSFIRRRRKGFPDVPLASMSDIAFLLLIFFIVAATIDVDTGISLSLPEYKPNEAPTQIEKKRVLEVRLSTENLTLNGKNATLAELYNAVTTAVRSTTDKPDDEKPITLLLYQGNVVYNRYIAALDQIKHGYKTVQDEVSRKKFGRAFRSLSEDDRETINSIVPVYISVGEIKNND
ncbi:MAG: biopolymer transporter ExbD [Ignavibacteriales bacterium]|nr:MAG: biopolymer transporter ExbD [Ignavibacteriaceae bacterium]MBW7872371.1 biopolymer transporter ExbD [Ignavibacteria bacterium]MCZ2142654.1 biopolymer transporter ExbD [Ignavibacteriales bacterium]OQY76067.1 MAG: hypothetical protein B6D45_04655 [Ignavibacteriales bacterium UTCHB3]MBV6445483.1 hypothetical protein [Ignavibacteriaceae bacterium]